MNRNNNNNNNTNLFHGNKILELKNRLVSQQRAEAKFLSANEFAKKISYLNKHVTKEVFGQPTHFFVDSKYENHSKALVITQDGPVILIQSEVLKHLNSEQLEALTAHELGHLHYNHTNLDNEVECEYEADEYSATIVGFDLLINALEITKKILPEQKFLQQRIDRLNKLKNDLNIAA